MRIRNIELLYSAAGGKEKEIYTFTDFNYLKPLDICQLLYKWLKIKLQIEVLEQISRMLQGRPRFFFSFLREVIVSKDVIDSNDVIGCFHRYLRDMTTKYDPNLENSSLYFFWKDRINLIIEPVKFIEYISF